MNEIKIQLDVMKVSQGGSRAQANMSKCESDVLSKCKNLKPIWVQLIGFEYTHHLALEGHSPHLPKCGGKKPKETTKMTLLQPATRN